VRSVGGQIRGFGYLCRHFGAEIVKVEPPRSGDPLRVWRELDVDGTSPWFRSLARNKKSVTIDMRKDEGRAWVLNFLMIISYNTI
jgi:crotonobetainyl-CoA:carnitine CoA-transferase CaiB-like acyl-CoA transferase